MQTPSRTTLGLTLLAFIGWGLFAYQAKQVPATVEKIVTKDKIVYQDRVVTKDVIRTETRPDGTRIVTESKAHSETKTDTHEVSKEQITVKPALTHYSLGLELGRELSLGMITKPNIYRMELGYRIGETPLWLTATAGTDKSFLLGIRVEF